ncbi:hypothetical protein [Leifsonia aquatica]|uniref:hypothetical protein n=1 Tax=Leifsonia aquatica TaxID=144185 RepID=UPI0037FB5441
MEQKPRDVRLFPDWGHRWPLWEAEPGPDMSPEDYGLSPGLTVRMRRWYDEWFDHFNPGGGWDDPDLGRAWLAEGGRLAHDLRVELGDGFTVEEGYRYASGGT